MSTNDSGGTAAKVAGTAKDEAAGLAHAAADSGQGLLQEARHEAADVASTAAGQARDLLGEARAGLTSQASEQQGKAAASLRTLGDELGRMADSSEGGTAADLVRQVAQRTDGVATWLEDREPGDVLGEVAEFARRRPGLFLALAAGAGVVAGRLTRGLKDATPAQHRAPGAARATDGAAPTDGAPATASAAPPVRTSVYDTPSAAGQGAYATGSGATTSWPPGASGAAGTTGAASGVGGPTPVAPASGHVPASGDGGTAGGDPLAGLTREDRP
ncbi:MAG: hypothetical protein IR158_00285 [Cellulomonas sp.]|jgi:hypothetical protein|uniref:hypothetical protein n=1 Tax=Cellulomonas sp. TaxID=40001 RepID=UPI0019EF8D0B|nr:hypothetical protein [Cellulomonas sp.]MBF0686191.1 hypothetical protein [Cellulomonas sp.]